MPVVLPDHEELPARHGHRRVALAAGGRRCDRLAHAELRAEEGVNRQRENRLRQNLLRQRHHQTVVSLRRRLHVQIPARARRVHRHRRAEAHARLSAAVREMPALAIRSRQRQPIEGDRDLDRPRARQGLRKNPRQRHALAARLEMLHHAPGRREQPLGGVPHHGALHGAAVRRINHFPAARDAQRAHQRLRAGIRHGPARSLPGGRAVRRTVGRKRQSALIDLRRIRAGGHGRQGGAIPHLKGMGDTLHHVAQGKGRFQPGRGVLRPGRGRGVRHRIAPPEFIPIGNAPGRRRFCSRAELDGRRRGGRRGRGPGRTCSRLQQAGRGRAVSEARAWAGQRRGAVRFLLLPEQAGDEEDGGGEGDGDDEHRGADPSVIHRDCGLWLTAMPREPGLNISLDWLNRTVVAVA